MKVRGNSETRIGLEASAEGKMLMLCYQEKLLTVLRSK